MKKIFCFIFLASIIISGQCQFREELLTSLEQLKKANGLTDYVILANRFELIATVSQKEWLPWYYASYCCVRYTYFETNDELRDAWLDKAQEFHKKASKLAPENYNHELQTLQGYIYQSRFIIAPFSRLLTNSRTEKELKNAIKSHPDNPRAYLLLGINTYYTPAFMGGGPKSALALLRTAQEKYSKFNLVGDLDPDWGKELTGVMIKRCLDKLKE